MDNRGLYEFLARIEGSGGVRTVGHQTLKKRRFRWRGRALHAQLVQLEKLAPDGSFWVCKSIAIFDGNNYEWVKPARIYRLRRGEKCSR